MKDRTRAQQLAAESLAKGDPTGWFERLYQEGEAGKAEIPWAEQQPNPNLLEFWKSHPIAAAGQTALVIGCGFGDDAEQLAAWGFATTAFDVSPTAVARCRKRFPSTGVRYVVADLLHPPQDWPGAFDFVFEAYTVQALPPALRAQAIERAAAFVKDGGHMLLIARGREEHEPEGNAPWPLTRRELEQFTRYGLKEVLFEEYWDAETPPARRFRVLFEKS